MALLRWTIADYHRMIAVGLLGDRHQPIAMFLMLQSPEVSALLSIAPAPRLDLANPVLEQGKPQEFDAQLRQG